MPIPPSLKRKLLFPVRLAWWTLTLQLPHGLELRRQRRQLLLSGLFDTDYYLGHNPDVAQAGVDPAEHYITSGAATRNPHPLFDTAWYLANNPDVASTGINPLLHYLSNGWRERRSPHPLFDVAFYLAENPDLVAAGVEPLAQYLRSGAIEGRDPHPLFDSDFYLAKNPEVAARRENPLAHYVTRGWREHRNPNPFFDVAFYLNNYPDIAQSKADPLRHYIAAAASENRDPHPAFDTHFYLQRYPEVKQAGLIPLVHFLRNPTSDPNRYFDVAFYCERNSSVPRTNVAAVEHYLREGASRGRNPHPMFDTRWYLTRYPDVAGAGLNPLLHFLQTGRRERRDPHPLFDSNFYLSKNKSFVRPDFSPPDHYLHSGGREGRDPHPLFDSDWYRALLPDGGASGENPLVHYLRQGWKERRSPCAYFDGAFYITSNPDVAAGEVSSLQHYLLEGAAQGRDPSATFDTDWYVAQNPDIIAAGWNPLMHYVLIGLDEGRRPRPVTNPRLALPAAEPSRRRIVFLSGEPDTPGHRYRILNIAHCLPPRFFETTIINSADAHARIAEVTSADVLWIWRTRLSAETGDVVPKAREAGVKIVFDVDDLMFRPDLASADLIDGIRTQNISEEAVKRFYQAIKLMVLDADRCTAPTIPLAQEIRYFQQPTTVIPNGFDSETLRRSRAALRARRSEPGDGLIRVGYASGTLTHQRDFAVAAPALAAVLGEHPNARLVLFRGAFDLAEFPELTALADQIEWRDRVPVENLPGEYARFDINIAPLEAGNRYVEAKSELKFFEAALAGVPTIASPTRPFADSIRNGETGLLAAGTRQWSHALTILLQNPELRRRLADQAYRDVLWLYGPERRRLLVTRLLNELLAPVPQRFDLFRAQMDVERPATPPPITVPDYELIFESPRQALSRVSVIMPLFNYAHLVREALESVRHQTMPGIDLIVADDCSTDDSVLVAQRWLERYADRFNKVALLKNRRNSKLGATRNTAVSFSETEIFMALDPDNALAPDCLEKCLAALEETGAAFAYPTIQLFGDRTGEIGTQAYDPALLPCANYIDAMAMVRKACWIAVGGYTALDPMGWEDYEFWCKMAEKGLYGVRVQETSARYRTHGQSMLATITNLPENKPKVVEDLNARHPWLQLRTRTELEDRLDDTVTSEAATSTPRPAAGLDRLLTILRCPETGERLIRVDAGTLASEKTARSWPIVDRRPVFTPEGRNIPIRPASHTSNEIPESALEVMENARGLVLNLSAGASTKQYAHVVELEYALFKNTDVAGDVHRLPFQDEVFDAVVCLNAMEHYRNPRAAIQEIRRVLKPGGRFFIRTAFLQPLHEAPHHYYNCTEFGLREWLRDFKVERLHVSSNFNPAFALAWLSAEALAGLRDGVSAQAAAIVGEAHLKDFAEFWQNPRTCDTSVVWHRFFELPPSTQQKIAAGFEALAQKT